MKPFHLLAAFAISAAPSLARGDRPLEELARLAQNPVADVASVPFQNDLGAGYGPGHDQLLDVLELQPVVPIGVTPRWNLVTQAIVPLVWQASLTGGGTTFGVGDVRARALLSQARPGKLIWGLGPVASFPTASSSVVGPRTRWGVGPSAVALVTPGSWVVGALADAIWSVSSGGANTLRLQYFVNYNLGASGWYLTSAPTITAAWQAGQARQWIVPFGGGVGKMTRIGKVPTNVSLAAYYNAVRPDVGPVWTIRLVVAFLLTR
jgi:hypothetical protein